MLDDFRRFDRDDWRFFSGIVFLLLVLAAIGIFSLVNGWLFPAGYAGATFVILGAGTVKATLYAFKVNRDNRW